MMRILKWLCVVLLSIFIIALIIVAWLSNTESGLRWALRQAPDTIRVHSIEGSLNNVTFKDLTLHLDGVDAMVASGRLQWALLPLLSRNVNIETLHLNGITVTTSPKQSPTPVTPYEPWQGLDLPINATLKSLQLNGIIVQNKSSANAETFETSESLSIEQLTAQLTLNDNVLSFIQLSLIQLNLTEHNNSAQLKGEVDLSAQDNAKLNLSHSATWQLGDNVINSNGTINGQWSAILITQNTELSSTKLSGSELSSGQLSPIHTQLQLQVNDALSHKINWQGQLQSSQTDVNLNTINNAARLNANNVSAPNVQLGAGKFSFTGAISPAEGLASLSNTIQGQISAGHQDFSQWRLKTDLSIENDSLSIRQFELNEFADAQNSAKQHGNLQIQGNIIGLSDFFAQTKNSRATANLQGQWHSLSWPLTSAMPALEKIVSNSNGTFKLRGQADDIHLTANADGYSYANPLTANIDVRVKPNLIDLNSVTFESGKTVLDVNGKLGEKLALNWRINAPNLSGFLPSLSGDFKSQGQLSGTRQHPQFNASANSTQFTYNGLHIAGVHINAKGALSSASDNIAVNASIASVQQANATIADNLIADNLIADNLKVALNGTGKKHQLDISSRLFGQSNFALMATGSIDDTAWHGQLETLELADPVYNTWRLKQPTAISFINSKINTELMCLANFSQSLCATLNANQTQLNASGRINAVDLVNLNPFLSLYDATASGLLNGNFDYQKTTSEDSARITAELDATDSVVTFIQLQGQPQQIAIASLNANLKQQRTINIDAKVELDNGDQATMALNIDSALGKTKEQTREQNNFSSAPINGKIQANFDDLSALRALAPLLSRLDGSLNSDITVSGSVNKPQLAMQAQLTDANLAIADLGLNLTAINLQATTSGQHTIELHGSLQSGQGELDVNGRLDLSKLTEAQVQLNLTGQSLELMHTPEIHIEGDVDLAININKNLLDLNGKVNLTQADLDFQLPENAILASPDVVLLGQEQAQKGMQTQMDLRLNLGTKTHIRAQGLDALLGGHLQILQEPEGILKGKGQIDVNEGKYNAYNQKLNIDKGQIIFSGGSIDDPSIDLRAQKKVNDITAGVSVSGRASAPLLRLYSTPSMTDQDVLSVLVFDKPIGKLGSQDGLTLLKIANSLRGNGQSQVGIMTQRIQDSLGLSSLELQLDGNEPSIRAGKQLSSSFYVGYGYGLLDAAQSLVLRYKINQDWSIQGDLGAESGADLRYQVER